MPENIYFILGLINNIFLILIFILRKNHLSFLKSYGWIYLLLAAPAIYLIFIIQKNQKALRYTIFLIIFLTFLFLEGLFDFILKVSFRSNWKMLVPYLILYYAMNYGFIVMTWKVSLPKGIVILVLFIVQIIVNFMSHF